MADDKMGLSLDDIKKPIEKELDEFEIRFKIPCKARPLCSTALRITL